MRALANSQLLEHHEQMHKYPESSSHPQIGEHPQANIISGTYINSSIILHNPGA
jgi:hypothetical protein